MELGAAVTVADRERATNCSTYSLSARLNDPVSQCHHITGAIIVGRCPCQLRLKFKKIN